MIQNSRTKYAVKCRLCRPGQKLKHAKLYRKEIEWTLKHAKGYKTAQEAFADILKKKKS